MSLIIKNLSKKFKNSEAHTLEHVNLEVEQGEFLCVVGASGCGKSTLLNLIAGLEQPTDGEITLDGKTITGPGADRTVMFQEHGLFPWLNVMDNVCFGMKMNGVQKEERERRAKEYLELVHLYEYKDYLIHQLSGGMRQRVALARALTMESQLLLMDEPFASLDKQTSNRLREELQRIWMETHRTIIFITHSVEEAIYLGDRVVVLSPTLHGVQDSIDIHLERPRHVYAPEFMEYRHRILDEVRGGERQ